jgi:NAD(P)-dependent dehydrogenase (short-subunit alcohol dehydrogenase family)
VQTKPKPLTHKIALVAGATRSAGRAIALELAATGAVVYVTGRSTRAHRSEMDRPETIEDTADLITSAGGRGIAVPTDHLDPVQVRALAERIDNDHGRLDILVNDIWGGNRSPKALPHRGQEPRQARKRHRLPQIPWREAPQGGSSLAQS